MPFEFKKFSISLIFWGCLSPNVSSCLRATKIAKVQGSGSANQIAEAPTVKPESGDSQVATYDSPIKKLLTQRCFSCHGENGSNQGGFAYALDSKKLIESGLVVPFKPDASLLYTRPRDSSMPPGTPLKAEENAIIQNWIAQGAPDFNSGAKRRHIADSETFESMINSLNATAEDKTDVRFISLVHLFNENVAEDKIEITRQAVSKLLNSLSSNPDIHKPETIGAEKLILKIRLKNYGWTAQTWADIANFNPYAVAQIGSPSFQTLKAFTGEPQFWFRADWMVVRISQPDLYYHILKSPGNLKAEALQVAGIDPGQELKATPKNFIRSAFYESGVSSSNRTMDRFIGPKSSFWLSYDFATNSSDTNIFLNPLGPRLIHEGSAQIVKPMGDRSFVNDGGEAIYNLPNGLLGFYVTTALGARLEDAPSSIVSQTDFGKHYVVIKAGFSCFQCHHQGLIDKKDEVRDAVASSPGSFSNEDTALINQIYVSSTAFSEGIRIDSARHKKALADAGVTHPIDPIILTHIAYSSSMGISYALAETGLTEGQLRQAINSDPKLSVTLSPMINGGLVNRSVFEFYFKDIMAKASGNFAVAPPAVKIVLPPSGASGLPLNAKITVLLSSLVPKAPGLLLLASSPQIKIFDQGGSSVAGATQIEGEVLIFSPSGLFAPDSNYQAELHWPESFELARKFVWTFKTGLASDVEAPLVSSIFPSSESIITSTDGSISINFNESMDSSALSSIVVNLHRINQGSEVLAGKISLSDRLLRFEASEPLIRGEAYEFIVSGKLRDLAGNSFAGEIRSNFTIRKLSAALELLKSIPVSGSQSHPMTQGVALSFNEELQAGSVNDNTVILRDSRQARAAGTFSLKGNELRFLPSPSLRPIEKYNLELTTQIRGVSGNRLKEVLSFSFITDDGTLKSVRPTPEPSPSPSPTPSEQP